MEQPLGMEKKCMLDSRINDTIHFFLNKLFSFIPENKVFTDIEINPDGSTFSQTNCGEIIELGKTLTSKEIIRIGTLLAAIVGSSLSEQHPSISASLDDGKKRFEILIPPLVENASLSLRLHSPSPFTIEDLVKKDMITQSESLILKDAVRNRKNIIISGETGSGKTTLLSALLNTIDKSERVIIIEDGCSEINCSLPNAVKITVNNIAYSSRDAVASSLRMNPDRIIYGETREGATALEMLKAWRTGHNGGISTLHAKSASQIYERLDDLLLEVTNVSKIGMIKNTVDVRIHCAFENNKRFVKEIII